MKTVILNGSPRIHGDTAALLNELKRNLQGDIVEFSAYRDDIGPCTDCRYCWKNDGCPIDDGMQAVYQALEEADNVVIASPLYFSQLTGPLLGLASRLQRYYAARRFRGERPLAGKARRGALVLVGGGDGNERPAMEMAGILFRHVNAKYVGMAFSHNTDERPAAQDAEALEKVRELAHVLNGGGLQGDG